MKIDSKVIILEDVGFDIYGNNLGFRNFPDKYNGSEAYIN